VNSLGPGSAEERLSLGRFAGRRYPPGCGIREARHGAPIARLVRANVLGKVIAALYPVDVAFDEEADARHFLEALRMDASHATATFGGSYGGTRRAWVATTLAVAPVLAGAELWPRTGPSCWRCSSPPT
jgi:hypothetical protein